MRQGAPGGDMRVGEGAIEMRIEKSVTVQVSHLEVIPPETDSAKTMHAETETGKAKSCGFNRLDRAQAFPVKEGGPGEEEGVKKLRGERQTREPAQVTHDKVKDRAGHGASFSARRLTWRITRRCTARHMSRVHQSKYQSGRTCRAYQERPINVVVPSPLSRS